jgi:SAM-dependent MidA family methyltransferase
MVRTMNASVGDFYTSSDVHSILGRAIAAQARQMDEYNVSLFTIVEMGR